MKPFVAYLNKLPIYPTFLAFDLLFTLMWVWIYLNDHKNKQQSALWLDFELTVVVVSSLILLLQLVAVYVKRQGQLTEGSNLTSPPSVSNSMSEVSPENARNHPDHQS